MTPAMGGVRRMSAPAQQISAILVFYRALYKIPSRFKTQKRGTPCYVQYGRRKMLGPAGPRARTTADLYLNLRVRLWMAAESEFRIVSLLHHKRRQKACITVCPKF